MSGHRRYKITDFRFGQMVLGLREKAGLTQKELADALKVSRRTVQHWEAGTAFPDVSHLKDLIATFLQLGVLNPGSEQVEAATLWAQADESAARRKSLFDDAWFDAQLQQYHASRLAESDSKAGAPEEEPADSSPVVDWGDAPDVVQVFGRDRELAELTQWIVKDRCRLVTILGMGGIGKTTIAARLVQDICGQFEYVIWRSLRNMPSLQDLLLEFLQILSPSPPIKPSIKLLIDLLKKHRCLLVLDNVESLHRTGDLSGMYREGYEEYQRFFQMIAQTRHKSCLLLTSREMPVELEITGGIQSAVCTMRVPGLNSDASQAMLTDKGLFGPDGSWEVFVHYYTGNPLALKIASVTVRDLFGGDLAAFLREAPVTLHTLSQMLNNQFENLSLQERDILYWLAIEREPVSLDQLRRDFLVEVSNNELLAGLLSLFQRSLIERSEQGAVFSALPVLVEFVTDRLVKLVVDQIIHENLEALTKYALIKSLSPDYVRDSQVKMILNPVIALLTRHFGSQSQLLDSLRLLVGKVRKLPHEAQGYAGGNLLNLFIHLSGHIRGEDFSKLVLRQAYLQGVDAQGVNLSGVEFIDSRFTEPLETIGAMMLSPSGTYLAASTYNEHLRCWNLADGKPIWTATNAKRTWSIAFSPDESMLACSNFHGQVSLWDVQTGRHVHTFEGHQEWVNTVAFDPSNHFLASGGIDAQVRIWDLQQMKLARVLTGHTARVWSLAVSPDGKLLVSGGAEESIHIWDFATGKRLRTIHHPAKGLMNVAFHPNGNWIASCCEQDPMIKLWDVHTGELIANLASRSDGPTSIAFHPDGSFLVSGTRDGSVELWQITAGQRPQFVKMLMGHHHTVSVIAMSANNLLASLSYGEDIKLWNATSGKLLSVIEGYNRLIGAVAFSPDGNLLFQGDSGGRIRVWNLPKHRYVSTFNGHTGPVWMIAFSPTGKVFATTGDDRLVRLWDTGSLELLKTYRGHTGPIWDLAFNPDGSMLASGGSAHWIMLWDTTCEEGIAKRNRFETPDDLWTLVFNPTGEVLVSGQTSGAVILWDLRKGTQKAILQHGARPIGAIRYASNGKTLITSSNQELLKFWDMDSLACIRTITAAAEGNRTKGVAIGEDGKLVATGSRDGTVYLWRIDLNTGEYDRQRIEGHTSRVWGMALSPDERYLASGDEEGTTLLTEVATGQVLEKISIDRPYEKMNINGVTGLNAAERETLKALGAVDGPGN